MEERKKGGSCRIDCPGQIEFFKPEIRAPQVRKLHLGSARFTPLNLRLRTFFCSNACLRVLRCFLRAFWNLRTFERFAHFSDETPLVAKFGTACVNNRYRAARARAGAAVC